MRSLSLTRSSPAPRITVVPRAKLATSTISGSSSISDGTSSGSTSVATSSACRTSMSATGSPPAQRRPNSPTRAPIRSSTASMPVRVGLMPTPWMVRLEPASTQPAAMNGAADEKSPGTSIPSRSRRVTGEIETLTRPPVDRHAGPAEHPLGVVAGGDRLLDRGHTVLGEQPREQQARLDLRRRDRQPVGDRLGVRSAA